MAQTYSSPTGDFVTSILSGAISAGSNSFTIGAGLTLPATNGLLQISYDSTLAVGVTNGPETIFYTSYNTSTGAVTGVTRGVAGTTAVQHDNGQSVQCAPSVLYLSDIYSGNLATGTSSVGVPVAAMRLEAWTAYTPTATGITVGNGTWDAAYQQVGKTVRVRVKFTLGSTSSITGSTTISLPVTAKTVLTGTVPVHLQHTGTSSSTGKAVMTSTSVMTIYAQNAAGTYLNDVDLSSTIPFSWASTDIIMFGGFDYEAA